MNVRKIPLQPLRYDSATSIEDESKRTLEELRKAVLTDRDLHDRVGPLPTLTWMFLCLTLTIRFCRA